MVPGSWCVTGAAVQHDHMGHHCRSYSPTLHGREERQAGCGRWLTVTASPAPHTYTHGVACLHHRAIDKRVVRRAVDEYGAVVYR